MKKSFILFSIIFIVFLSSYPAQAGYWQLSGDGEIIEKPEYEIWKAAAILNSFDANHVDTSYKTFDWDTEWTRAKYTWDAPPQIIRPGEVIPVSVSYSVTGFFREPRGCDIAFYGSRATATMIQLIGLYPKEDDPREGKITNTKNKAPSFGREDPYTVVQYTCFLLKVNYPYKWVEDETPPVSQPSTNSKTLAVGETWNVGEGYTLTANSIDAKGGQIWLVLSKNGKKLDDSFVNVGETYTYNNLKIKITKISAGAISDTVTLTDTSAASSTPGITPGVPVTSSTTCFDSGMGASGGNCIYSNGNVGGVYNNPTSPTTFTLTSTYNVMSISTYHYNSGRGATPGTISLKDSSGKTVGTWTATGRYGNFYWDVTPNIKLGPGTYTVIDSDTSTWAQNSETNNQGMFIVKGTLATTTGITPDKGTTTVTAKRTTPKPGATTPQGDFTVSISPTEMTVDPGENIRFTLTVEPDDDFNEPVEIYVKTEALGIEKDYGRVKIINPPYKPYVFEKQVPDSIPKGTTITGYVTARGGGLEHDADTVTVNVPGFGTLLAIGALGMAMLFRKRR